MKVQATIDVSCTKEPREGSLMAWDGGKWAAETRQSVLRPLREEDESLRGEIASLRGELLELRSHVNALAKAIKGEESDD